MSLIAEASQSKNYSTFKEDEPDLQNHKQTFDTILSKLSFGTYQILIFLIVGVIGMCDAGET